MKVKIFLIAFILFLLNFSIHAQKLFHVQGQLLVRFMNLDDVEKVIIDFQTFQNRPTNLKVERMISKQLNIWLLSFDHNMINEINFKNAISHHSSVETIQVNHVLFKRATIPNDPFFVSQWQWMQEDDHDVDAELAWDITTGGYNTDGTPIVVAVFDNGIDLDHPDLVDNIWTNNHEIPNNGIDDDNNGYIDDFYGWNFPANNDDVNELNSFHGTIVIGMIGAVGNNNNQVTGINWNVQIMNIVTEFQTQEASILEFYSYALDQRQRFNDSNGELGSFVVATNSSWGVPEGNPDDAPLWCNFYNILGEEGILNFAATTNEDENVDIIGDLPSTCPSEFLISVTSTDDQDIRHGGYGSIHIDLGAPGENVLTTDTDGSVFFANGTSLASPLVAGIVALMYAAPCSYLTDLAKSDPQQAAELVRDYLFLGVDPVSNLENELVTGGRVNAYNSLQLIMDDCGPCSKPAQFICSNLTDTSTLLSWYATDSLISFNIRYRKVVDNNWINDLMVDNPYTFNGLMACTEYEYQVEGICSDISSGFTPSFTFTTECCLTPNNLDTLNVSSFSADLIWENVLDATGYTIRYKEMDTPDWLSVDLESNSILLNNLDSCENYQVQVRSNCLDDQGLFSDTLIFRTDCIDPVSNVDIEEHNLQIEIYPNPFHNYLTVAFNLSESGSIQIDVYNVNGQLIYSIENNTYQSGRHVLLYENFQQLSKGVYFISLKTSKDSFVKKVIKVNKE